MARNTNRQGADSELSLMKYFAARSWTAWRSSGSRGIVDVTAVGPASLLGALWGRSLVFVQSKVSNPLLSPADRLALVGLAMRAGALPIVQYKAREGRLRPIRFRLLTGTGPKDFEPWHPLCPAHGDLCGPYEEH